MKKQLGFFAICVALVMIFACALPVFTYSDKNNKEFVEEYLQNLQMVVDFVMDDYDRNCEKESGTYVIGEDGDGNIVVSKCFGDEGHVTDERVLQALKSTSCATNHCLNAIHVTKDRVTFVAGLGMEGIIYMKPQGKPSYFISPDRRGERYRMTKLCDHWYQIEMLVR